MNLFVISLLIGFLVELLNMAGGGDDSDGDENWIGLSLFSRFLIGFGASGILLYSLNIGWEMKFLIASLNGVILVILLKKLLRFINKSGNPSMDIPSFDGMKGVVITPIHANKAGEISICLKEKKYFLKAYGLENENFPLGEDVTVICKNGNSVKVKKLEE